MNATWKGALSEQFGASLDMPENALRNCPEELWAGRMWNDSPMLPEFSEFWYVGYHALFWLDFYLSGAAADFIPPEPFTLSELDPAGKLPDRQYTRMELLAYLEQGRRKGVTIIVGLNDEKASKIITFNWGSMIYLGLLIDIIRHNQEHGAQLSMFLGQQAGISSTWVTMQRE
ncbi:MAG: DinB family protein [Anaerolineaceae bacterium]